MQNRSSLMMVAGSGIIVLFGGACAVPTIPPPLDGNAGSTPDRVELPPRACENVFDCIDGDFCTDDFCTTAGECVSIPRECGDGLACEPISGDCRPVDQVPPPEGGGGGDPIGDPPEGVDPPPTSDPPPAPDPLPPPPPQPLPPFVQDPLAANCGCPDGRVLALQMCPLCDTGPLCYDTILVETLGPTLYQALCADGEWLERTESPFYDDFPEPFLDSDGDGFLDKTESPLSGSPNRSNPFDRNDTPDSMRDADGDGSTDYSEHAGGRFPFNPVFRTAVSDNNPLTGIATDGEGIPPWTIRDPACVELYVQLDFSVREMQVLEAQSSGNGCPSREVCMLRSLSERDRRAYDSCLRRVADKRALCFDFIRRQEAGGILQGGLRARIVDLDCEERFPQRQELPPFIEQEIQFDAEQSRLFDAMPPLDNVEDGDVIFGTSGFATRQFSPGQLALRGQIPAPKACGTPGQPSCEDIRRQIADFGRVYVDLIEDAVFLHESGCVLVGKPGLDQGCIPARTECRELLCANIGWTSCWDGVPITPPRVRASIKPNGSGFWPDEKISNFLIHNSLPNVKNVLGMPSSRFRTAIFVKGAIYDEMAKLALGDRIMPSKPGDPERLITASADDLRLMADGFFDYAAMWCLGGMTEGECLQNSPDYDDGIDRRRLAYPFMNHGAGRGWNCEGR